MENYMAYEHAVNLWKIVSPVLILLGNAGNILVVIVLTRKRARRSSTSVFLSALAFSDLLALDTGLLRQWIKYTFADDIRIDHSVFGCRVHWYVVYIVTQYSSWILTCVTTERVVSTWFPHQRKKVCNVTLSIIIAIVILVALCILNSHYLIGYGDMHTTTGNETVVAKCVPTTPEYDRFISYAWAWIDLAVYYLIPMLFLLIGNSLIIFKVLQSRRKFRSRSTVAPNAQGVQARANPVSSLTMSLMLVNVVFMVCITPIVVYPIGEPFWKVNASDEKLANMFLIDAIANLLMYVNHSINFALYFLSGTVFRNDVKRLLCGSKVAPISSDNRLDAFASRAQNDNECV
ncbi:hypothetical protein DPMN_104131 [Dreissena polymorpha]|uniref:G-protein coupled receptors family 1 profile domain-containing protein n=1 Tax=Dreissena polymorpha TaxID=45954 RepID=A0A9D4H9C2_DREPO|nr:hypothetical protein DPMN_104131 [Dreissena polymorpha]